ncbi:hypothetical protein [Sciscionella sediminilitoris]|uniref:hypothetical protein n=1 Tax=Sciscionella sediminilitoris TaxID=1445613 RepID=UPI0012E1B8B3|nr:hypothetical protein [Sciscionella sp. SE31]
MTSSTGIRARARNPYLIGSVVLLVIALGFAVYFGLAWIRASTSQDTQYATAREDVLRVGGQTAINVTTIDYRRLDQLKGELENSTTGDLHEQVGKTIDKYKKQMGDTKLITRSDLVESAVVNLDTHANTASILAVVNSTNETQQSGDKNSDDKNKAAPKSQRLPITVNLTRADGNAPWKASSVSGAPVMTGDSGN